MTPDQQRRKKEFDQLFESIPGKNTDRIKRVCDILFCKNNSVRIWRMANPPRVIPDAKLKILQRALTGEA
jgi:hypothetical protein